MLNGKFFTGLPAGMMDRRNGPDRQRSQFFWPDESDMESAVNTKTVLRNKQRIERTPEKTIPKEVDPNELHKKELSSKINLTENFPREEKRTPVKQAIVKPNNITRRDTFSSKIQFYDYDNEPTPQPTRRNLNSQIDVEKNLKNTTKTCDKRISFTENKLHEMSHSTQGILKNNESRPKPVTRIVAKPKSKNISKSKSLSDINAANTMDIIENNVRNITISRNQTQAYDEQDDYTPLPRKLVRPTQRLVPMARRIRPTTEYYDDIEDDYGYQDSRRSPAPRKPPSNRRTYRDYEVDPGFEDTYISRSSRGNVHAACQYYSDKIAHRSPAYEDEYDYHFEERRSEVPKRTFERKSQQVKVDRTIEFDSSPDCRQQKQSTSPPDVDRNIDEGQKPNNHVRQAQIQIKTPPAIAKPQTRAHRHLVSNIAFWSDTETPNNTAKSIRSSAVMRVSVGLPDH